MVQELGPSIPERAGVLVRSKGLVAPLGTLPCAYVAERTKAHAVACLGGPGAAAEELSRGDALVVACATQAFLGQIADVLRVARFDVQRTTDVTGVELAGAARNAAVLAASAAAPAGASVAGAAADMVLAEVDAYARRQGGHPRPSPTWRATATAPRRSTTCRCWPSPCARTGSMRRPWPAWPTSSPAASSPSAGPPP